MGAFRKCALAAVMFCALLILSGCSDPFAGRQAVSGTVNFKGGPLKTGIIMFEPQDKQDTSAGAPIEKGSYSIPRQKGLKPGKYLVRISAGDGITPARLGTGKNKEDIQEAAGPGGSKNIISKELIPITWNAASQQVVTIEAGNANQKNFDIPEK
jgi:hypothetical protein